MTQIAIGADFLTAYGHIPRSQQKKVREFITRFQQDPTLHSINYEPIHDTLDSRVRTVRIGLDYRAIVLHPDKGDVYLLAWVDHHDEAMEWAKRKRFEINPVTGALQVIDTQIVSAVEEALADIPEEPEKLLHEYALFETFPDEALLRTGLPELLLPTIRQLKKAYELDKIQPYLPTETYEALWWVANLGYSIDQALAEIASARPADDVDVTDVEAALQHPDTQRRFAIVQTVAELQEMLNAPLAKWRVFLHPSQAALVERHFNGPVRILGGAGTGKTVVAMHRARHLVRTVYTQPTDRILFTTFTRNLANNIERNLQHLCGPEMERIEVVNLHRWAVNFLRNQGFTINIASDNEVDYCWDEAIRVAGAPGLPEEFYFHEWDFVVKANGIQDKASYLRVSRRGQGTPLNRVQRTAVWDVFAEFQRQLDQLGKIQWMDVFTQARLYLERKGAILPYRAIVVDETQDLFPEELRLIRQMVPEGSNDLFFVGDAHQRIYGRPVVMSHCGINIRGRSRKLRINYRTTEEIRNWAVAILAGRSVDDLDGGEDDQHGYRSLLHGLTPTIEQFNRLADEQDYLITAIESLLAEDVAPDSICLVARTNRQIEEYQLALQSAGWATLYLQSRTPDDEGPGIRMATMHRVKGLEFAHVLIAGVNDGILPYVHRLRDPLDEEELLQERCLLHVAATRARDTLTVTCYGQPSPFLGLLNSEA